MLLRFLIGCMALVSSAHAGYFMTHTVGDYSNNSFTLEDGSHWLVNNAPNSAFADGTVVWIMPTLQETFSAVMIDTVFGPTSAQIIKGSTTLTITNISNGVFTLSDNSQWQLDPYYQNYTVDWAVGDPITYGGHKNSLYLINGNTASRTSTYGPTYSLASKASSGS